MKGFAQFVFVISLLGVSAFTFPVPSRVVVGESRRAAGVGGHWNRAITTPSANSWANEQSKACSDHYCQNGGLCIPVFLVMYNCQCQPGWTGHFCEESTAGTTPAPATTQRPTGVCPTLDEVFAKIKDKLILSTNTRVTVELAGYIVDALATVYKDQGTLEGKAAQDQFVVIMSDGGTYREAPKDVMDLIVYYLNSVFNEVSQCWNWANKYVSLINSMTTTGVCPTVEQALAKVKDNLRANILVTDELASHIVDALTKVYTDQGTLEGTAALEQFLEIMSDNGKYTEAPKEIMDLIVLQLNTVYNVAPQCWNWAKKFVDMIRPYEKHALIPELMDAAPAAALSIVYHGNNVLGNNSGYENTPTQVRYQPLKITWAGMKPDNFYTTIMIDPDMPSRSTPIAEKTQVLHWLMVNIPGNGIGGRQIAPYIGSGPPPNTGIHRYTFLIFDEGTTAKDYTSIQPVDLVQIGKRVNWNFVEPGKPWSLRGFMEWAKLGKPVAGNFYTAQWDTWVDQLWRTFDTYYE